MKVAVATLVLALAATGFSAQGQDSSRADMAALVQSLNLDPPVALDLDCPPVPSGGRQVLFAGVFANQPPIRPDSADFPAEFCPANTLFYALAEGQGNSSAIGRFLWSERYCALPTGELVAKGYFEGTGGDRVDWDARIRSDTVPPPIPFATFSGEFTFTGGTGAFSGVSGEGRVVAKQLGDAAPGRPAGSTAAAVCGWVRDGGAVDPR